MDTLRYVEILWQDDNDTVYTKALDKMPDETEVMLGRDKSNSFLKLMRILYILSLNPYQYSFNPDDFKDYDDYYWRRSQRENETRGSLANGPELYL